MLFDKTKFEELFKEAEKSPRLRTFVDLRNSPEDNTQRMLNILLPGTVVPIHRHETEETLIVLQGSLTEVFFDAEGNITERNEINKDNGSFGITIPAKTWHTVIVHEPTVTFEGKDGKYIPSNEVCPFEDKFIRE